MTETGPAPGSRWRRPGRTEGLTLLILVLALAAGVSGGLLLHVQGTPPPPTSTLGAVTLGQASTWVEEVLAGVIVLCVVLLVAFILRRIARGGTDWTSPLAVIAAFLIVVAALAVFLLAADLVIAHGVSGVVPGEPTGKNNTTGSPPTGPGGSNGTGHGTGSTPGSGSSSPPVLLLGYLVPVVLVLGLVVVPLVLVLISGFAPPAVEEARGRGKDAPAEVTRLLSEALNDLRRGDAASARETILLAYSALLAMLRESGVKNLDRMTARDVEDHMRRSLGVTVAGSSGLRQLFEEARYSAHPMSSGQAEQAKVALQQVLDEVNNLPMRIHAHAPTVVTGTP